MYIGLHAKRPLFLSDSNETNFLENFSKKYSNITFHELRPTGAGLFHADGRTDENDEANRRFP